MTFNYNSSNKHQITYSVLDIKHLRTHVLRFRSSFSIDLQSGLSNGNTRAEDLDLTVSVSSQGQNEEAREDEGQQPRQRPCSASLL
jgi:hypothetical protein